MSAVAFGAFYQHRKKGFIVVASEPAWWNALGKEAPGEVLVMRCGLSAGRMEWPMSVAAFLKTYEVVGETVESNAGARHVR